MKRFLCSLVIGASLFWGGLVQADYRVTPQEKQLGQTDTNEKVYEWRSDDRLYVYDVSSSTNVGFYIQQSTGNILVGDVGIDSRPNANAILELSSTTKGFLLPRANASQWNSGNRTYQFGSLRANTTNSDLEFFNGAVWMSCTKSAS